jgi:ketosteroid isomerase-like protein
MQEASMLRSALLMTLLPAFATAAAKQIKSRTGDRDAALEIIAMERDALERGARGDADAFVRISAPDVVYFDPFLERRIDGLAALKEYYHNNLKPPEEDLDIELTHPKVQLMGDVAILTFNYRSTGRRTGRVEQWNCTEVFQHTAQGWRIIQTHWSWTRPQFAPARENVSDGH